MKHFVVISIAFFLLVFRLHSQSLYVNGHVKDAELGTFLSNATILINNQVVAFTDNKGFYFMKTDLTLPISIKFKLLGYKTLEKKYQHSNSDTLTVNVELVRDSYMLPGVSVSAQRKVDTVFGTWKFSVADYEFYEDKILLLTFKKSLKHPSLVLVDYNQNILLQSEIDFEVKELIKDFSNSILLVGEFNNYYIDIRDNKFVLQKVIKSDYAELIEPLITQKNNDIYFSNYDPSYPDFTYYSYCTVDSSVISVKRIVNQTLMHEYNMEYYFLKPKEQLYVRNIAQEYRIDFHKVAAVMSGLTSSIFYEPLYDPMFLINDTICIFNHCNDLLFKYDLTKKIIDSVSINYHHPKNWREWKNKLIADENEMSVYALFQKNGFYYLKKINISNGTTNDGFKFYFPNVENIKIKDGYVFYIYRPFESLQEQFLYKELIIK